MALSGTARARDYAWAALAVVVAALAVLNLAACLFFLLRGNIGVLLTAPVGLLFSYWIGMGAWRRTLWGRPQGAGGEVPSSLMPAARARRLILLGSACAIALALALALQVVAGRS